MPPVAPLDPAAEHAPRPELAALVEQLRGVMDHSSDAFFVSDAEGNYLDCNRTAEELTGYSAHELRSMRVGELVSSDAADLPGAGGSPNSRAERLLRRKDGSNVVVELRERRLADGRHLGMARDVSERRQAEQALRESEAAFRALFEASPVPTLLARVGSAQIWLANEEARKALGLDERGLEQLDLRRLFVASEAIARLHAVIETHGRDAVEATLRLAAGERECVVSARQLAFHGQDMELVTFVDVTDRRREEASLREAQKLESLGVLTGGIAHDFNNLLTPILANVSLARETLDAQHPAREMIDDVEESARRAAGLVGQMLTYAGKGRLRVEPHELGQLVRELTPLLAVATTKKARLAIEPERGLPNVDLDAAQVRQMVLNLVTNASEAIGDRVGTICVRVRRVRLDEEDLRRLRAGHELSPGNHVVLEVIDDGVGMSRETLERVFDPFYSTKGPGRGLGLSVLLGIARSHRAAVEVESSEQGGTAFRVYFRPSEAAARARSSRPSETRAKLSGRVLLADDDPAVRASVTRLLRHLGLEVTSTDDGEEAVAEFERRPNDFDVVLLDVTMPRMGGLEALERIRARAPELPCVLCSGYSDRDVAIPEGKQLAFLAKPYSMQDVQRCLSEMLAARPR
jgi:PAS domain S-box-containing protein